MRIQRTCNLLALLAALLAPGCATNQALRQALTERDLLIGELRQENTDMSGELSAAEFRQEQLTEALDAAMKLPAPEPAPEDYPSLGPAMQLGGEDLDSVGVSVSRRGDDVVFTIPSKITFASGSATLSREGEDALAAVGRRLKSDFGGDVSFYIEGHTDSDRIRRSKFASNRDLSWARARAVHQYVVEKAQIDDARFVVVGHGPHRPVASNDTDSGKAKNRRVELIVRSL